MRLAIALLAIVTCVSLWTVVEGQSQRAQRGCPRAVTRAIRQFRNQRAPRSSVNPSFGIATGNPTRGRCDFLERVAGASALQQCDRLCKRRSRRRGRGRRRGPFGAFALGGGSRFMAAPAITACNQPAIQCQQNSKYRTADGSCNNFQNERWGQTGQAQPRWLTNNYSDGKSKPRRSSCQSSGSQLPSARRVSNIIHRATGNTKKDSKRSLMLMQWGQFTAHDIVITHTIPDLDCGGDDVNNDECFNIKVPSNDAVFNDDLPFPRSDFVLDCNDVRQQTNDQSGYIDGSQVYGPDLETQLLLRGNAPNGKLETINNKLPENPDESSCILTGTPNSVDNYCNWAGDIRADEQPCLASIHTLFVRLHNRIADGLKNKNSGWSDETIFQEAKKIVSAILQHITYKEFLPALIGRRIMRKHNIHINLNTRYPFKKTYNKRRNASPRNAFNVAALRMGHSLIANMVGQIRKDNTVLPSVLLKRHFFRPDLYHSSNGEGLENMLRWFARTKVPRLDRLVESSARNTLFVKDDDTDGSDLAALNIQRGRDHGVPSYNKFRTFCKLSRARHFKTYRGGLVDMEPGVARLFERVYDCPDDIDLFSGLLAERPLRGLIVGPLLRCLLVKQFSNLRKGDRFFYEEKQTLTGFTKYQLRAIKKISLASVICENTATRSIQKNVFFQKSYGNPKRRCSQFTKLNLDLWKDRSRSNGGRSNRPRSPLPRSNQPRNNRPRTNRPRNNQPRSNRPRSNRPRSSRPRSNRSRGNRSRGNQSRSNRSRSNRPRSNRPRSFRPRHFWQF